MSMDSPSSLWRSSISDFDTSLSTNNLTSLLDSCVAESCLSPEAISDTCLSLFIWRAIFSFFPSVNESGATLRDLLRFKGRWNLKKLKNLCKRELVWIFSWTLMGVSSLSCWASLRRILKFVNNLSLIPTRPMIKEILKYSFHNG